MKKNTGFSVDRAAIAKRDADRAAFTPRTKRAARFVVAVSYTPQFLETAAVNERRITFSEYVELKAANGLCCAGESCGACWDAFNKTGGFAV